MKVFNYSVLALLSTLTLACVGDDGPSASQNHGTWNITLTSRLSEGFDFPLSSCPAKDVMQSVTFSKGTNDVENPGHMETFGGAFNGSAEGTLTAFSGVFVVYLDEDDDGYSKQENYGLEFDGDELSGQMYFVWDGDENISSEYCAGNYSISGTKEEEEG